MTDRGAASSSMSADELPPMPGDNPPTTEYSDDDLARYFTKQSRESPLRDKWIYVAERAQWYVWNENVWRPDTTLAMYDNVRNVLREITDMLMLAADDSPSSLKGARAQATAVRSAMRIAAVERLLRADREHAVSIDALDADPMVLSTPAGVVDLATGELRKARLDDYCTRSTRVSPARGHVRCEAWSDFLDDITNGDDELIAFLQRYAGYCLTGETREHVMLFLWGTGANGKSTFLNLLLWLLGDYAMTAAADTFMESRVERHPADLAMLRGARLVVAQEIDEGRQWALGRIKALTGGDNVTARFMRGDFFEYRPQFKLIFGANHRPGLRNVDEAMKRRMRLIPFTVTIPEAKRDPELLERLKAEGGAILAWAIRGCLEWQVYGLNPPPGVQHATAAYFESEDAFSTWLHERCEQCAGDATAVNELYHDYAKWTERGGEHAISIRRFGRSLEDHGFLRHRYNTGVRFKGLRLRAQGDIGAFDYIECRQEG